MGKSVSAFVLSIALAVSLVPGLAYAGPEDDLLAAGATNAPVAFAEQAAKAPEVAVVRAASSKLAVKVGKTYKLGAAATVGKLSYKSSDKKVAIVTSKGVVKAKSVGKTTITITAKNGSQKTSKNVSVTVLAAKEYKAVKKLKVKASDNSLAEGDIAKVKVAFSPTVPSNRNVVFKSSDPKVLTVSRTGKVRALKAGEAKVTVTSCDNVKAKASITIKVKQGYLLNRSTWKKRMTLPTSKQIAKNETYTRSPYLVCWPKFDGLTGFTEYAVDFRADSQPKGTYVNIGNWWMDVSSLKKRYKSVATDDGDVPGGMYAGFQVLEDGRKVAIMSVWKMYLIDENNNITPFNAKRIYPENPRIADDFGGEGTGVKTLVDYDWQAGKTYRSLIQCGKTNEGNCEVTFSVCDLETGTWTKLVAYDLGYGDTRITNLGCFLENYVPRYASEVRTVQWGNFRAKSHETGSWVSAKKAKMERQFQEWTGSYNYGSDSSCFWAITSGVPDLNPKPPANGKEFSVTKAEEGDPKE